MSEPKETIFEHEDHTVPPTASTLTVFAVLLALTVIQIAVGFSDLGAWKLVAALVIAGTEIAVLSYFFMDLKQADALTWLCVGAAAFWIFLLFLFTLTDYLTRYIAGL